MKKFLKISATIVILAGTVLLLGFADSEHHNLICQSVVINVLNPGDHALVTQEEILDFINEDSRPLTGRRIESLNLNRIERNLVNHPYISQAEVYSTIDGLLSVTVGLRYPVVRVINLNDEHALIDREGVLIPLSDAHRFNLTIANGFIPESFAFGPGQEIPLDSLPETSALRQIHAVGTYIHDDPFLAAMIEQIYVDPKGQIELIPQLGRQVILLGDATGLEKKLGKLPPHPGARRPFGVFKMRGAHGR